MELFYTKEISEGICTLSEEESGHCVKVLRHRTGDEVYVIDGEGTLLKCSLLDASPKAARLSIIDATKGWGSHPYHLTMGVCPTKNIDRFEWFAEKAAELGFDTLVPTIGEHSERKAVKTERIRKILVSAAKQSLKAAVPTVREPESVSNFIRAHRDTPATKLIAYCFEDETAARVSIKDALCESCPESVRGASMPEIIILIGPEGDFSREEAKLALDCGFRPVHLGESRLRTETAALAAVAAVYFHNM